MKITQIKVFPVNGDDKLKAFVTVKIDDCFIVRDMKVINGSKGYFVAMPSKKLKDGKYMDLAHPVNSKTRSFLERKVLEEFNRVVA